MKENRDKAKRCTQLLANFANFSFHSHVYKTFIVQSVEWDLILVVSDRKHTAIKRENRNGMSKLYQKNKTKTKCTATNEEYNISAVYTMPNYPIKVIIQSVEWYTSH